jgi:hypothetical protein
MIRKEIKIKRSSEYRMGYPTIDYIGMESRITTLYFLSIPIYKKIELFLK